LLNLTFQDLGAPEAHSQAGDQLAEAERKGVLVESIHRRKDGSTFFAEVSAQGATVGGIRTLVSVIRDISERKTAEEAMRKRELRLRQALRVSRSFAFEWNPTTDEVTRSEECGPLLGLQGDEAVHDTGRGFFLRVHPEDRERFFALLQALTPENPSYITKYRLVRPDGNVLILEETGLGFFDTRQRLSWLTGISTDVTEREMSREEIAYLASFPKLNTNAITEVDLDGQLRFCNPTAERLFPDLVQRGLDHPWLSDWAAVARAFYGRSSDRIEREVAVGGQWYHQTLHFLPESRRVRVYGLDITELKVAEQALHTSEARFRLLAGTAAQLLAAKDPQVQINELAVRVMAHLGCQCFFNFLAIEGPPDRLRLNAWAGIPPEEARRIEWLDYGVAVCGCAARDGARIVAERIPATHDIRTELVKSYGIKAYACHPLLGVNGRVLGTLSFGTRDRETFSEEDLELMEAVAGQVAVAMMRMQNERDLLRGADALQQANEELEKKVRQRTCELEDTVASLKNEISARKKIQTQLRELSRKSLEALEADRRSVARELHDSIGGSLAAIKFGLEGLAELAPREPVDGGRRLETLISHLADTIKETKRISASLRPLAIDDLGLLATIEWHIRQFCQRYENIRVVRQIDVEEQEIPEGLKIVIYRVMQEAFTNAARHSRADTLRIRLARSGSQFEFEVQDNGCGFDPNEVMGRHDRLSGFGLKSMQERAEICGGAFELRTRPEAGTSVRITLPDAAAASGLQQGGADSILA
jgi:signal transduction histidine kinase